MFIVQKSTKALYLYLFPYLQYVQLLQYGYIPCQIGLGWRYKFLIQQTKAILPSLNKMLSLQKSCPEIFNLLASFSVHSKFSLLFSSNFPFRQTINWCWTEISLILCSQCSYTIFWHLVRIKQKCFVNVCLK